LYDEFDPTPDTTEVYVSYTIDWSDATSFYFNHTPVSPNQNMESFLDSLTIGTIFTAVNIIANISYTYQVDFVTTNLTNITRVDVTPINADASIPGNVNIAFTFYVAAGTSGTSGSSGSSGTSGSSGSSGTSGSSGSSGTSGSSGSSGSSGTSGSSGSSGSSGTSGTGFSAVTNPALTRILTSDGTPDGAIAETNYTFDGEVVTLYGSELIESAVGSSLGSGNHTIQEFSSSTGSSAFFDYVVVESGGSRRAGFVMAVWDSSDARYTDNSTPDLNGSTEGITFSVSSGGGVVRLSVTVTSGTWDVKTATRIIF
jgi:hypothetical protein